MLVKPNQKISQKITDITGITNEMVKDKPPIDEVLPKFIEFIGGLPLVAHNIDFDYGFYAKIIIVFIKRNLIVKSCTMKMYKEVVIKESNMMRISCAKLR